MQIPTSEPFFYLSERVFLDAENSANPLAIGVEEGRVVELRSHAEVKGTTLPQLDFGARPIVPAWVNGHAHLAMAPLRGITDAVARKGNVVKDVFFRIETHLTGADVRVFSRLGAFECILSGIGEVWDHYYFAHEVAEAFAETGLTGVIAPTLQDVEGPFTSQFSEALEATQKIARDRRFRELGIRAALGPHASDTVSDAAFQKIRDVAENERLPVHLHLAQSAEEVLRARNDAVTETADRVVGLLGRVPVLFAHGHYLSARELALVRKNDWTLAFCPLSQVQFGLLGPALPYRKLDGGLVLGTDCVASNDAHSIQRELSWLSAGANMAASFSPERATFFASGLMTDLKRADERRAEASFDDLTDAGCLLGVGHGLALEALDGVPRGIRVGAWANFQVLDLDAPELFPEGGLARRLAYGDTKEALHALVLRGQVIGAPGAFRQSVLETALYRETRSEAEARRGELFRRAGVAHLLGL